MQDKVNISKNNEDSNFSLICDKSYFIKDCFINLENIVNDLDNNLKFQSDLFDTLCDKFPNVSKFKNSKANIKIQLEQIKMIKDIIKLASDESDLIIDLANKQDSGIKALRTTINKISILSKHCINLLECDLENNRSLD